MYIADQWKAYELIDTTDGMRLERWDRVTLERPDPQVIWKNCGTSPLWGHADAVYRRSKSGGGHWERRRQMPEAWTVAYEPLRLTFRVRPMGFKHTGLFPEQAANWDWFSALIRHRVQAGRPVRVLNLFAYTGGATLAAARAGATVAHVDAAGGMNRQAGENAALSGLSEAPIRYLTDDCEKFVAREIRRGNRYDAVIMDPPSYGRGPGGELWKLEDKIFSFVCETAKLLSDAPLFFLLNSYTTGLSASTMGDLLTLALQTAGKKDACVESGEVGLPVTASGIVLPCGAAARVTFPD